MKRAAQRNARAQRKAPDEGEKPQAEERHEKKGFFALALPKI
jgi:hypothetical protein